MRLGWLGTSLLATCVLACTELRQGIEVAPTVAASPSDPAESPPAPLVAPNDAETPRTPPADRRCAEPWTLTTKSDSGCTARQVRVIDPQAGFASRGVAITRTSAGRVGLAFHATTSIEGGDMKLAVFTPTAPDFATPTVLTRRASQFDALGASVRLATSAPDTIHVLAHDVAQDAAGDLRVYEVGPATTAFGLPETVTNNLRKGSEIAFAVTPSGTTFVSARVLDLSGRATLAVFRQSGNGKYDRIAPLASELIPNGVPEAGATALHLDGSGGLHALYQMSEVTGLSTPRYHVFDGEGWSYRKTIDNPRAEGTAGFSPRLATFGARKFAVYYFRRAGQSARVTAELRLATWEGADETPEVQVLVPSVYVTDATSPMYRVAMGVDPFGLLHLAVVEPKDDVDVGGRLVYRRQVIVGGSKVWLEDVVDEDVLTSTSRAFVDMVVDENARPHIAYTSAKDQSIRYATRYDR